MTKQILLLSFFALFSFSLLAGGPWPKKKGTGFYKLAQTWIVANQHYTDEALLDPNTTFATYTSSFYAEYGITDRLTAVAYIPFFTRSLYNNSISQTTGETIIPGEAVNAFGDVDVSLTYGLVVNKPVVVSASFLLGFPTGNSGAGTDLTLQTGDGEFNQMLRLDLGASAQFGKVSTWYSAYAGFNNRTNDFSDEIRYGIEAGGQFFDQKLLGILRLYGVSSLQNGAPSALSPSTSLFANNAEYVAFSPELAFNVTENVGISASVATAFWGKIIFAAPTYSVGVYLNM